MNGTSQRIDTCTAQIDVVLHVLIFAFVTIEEVQIKASVNFNSALIHDAKHDNEREQHR